MQTTTWQPKHDQLIVRPLTPADRTASGLLVIPEEGRERPQSGIVIAAGPGMVAAQTGVLVPVSSQVGDLVAFGKYAGSEFDVDGKRVLVMRDLEAILRKPAGSYELVEHEDGKYAHEAGFICDHCPTDGTLAALREEFHEERRAGDDGIERERAVGASTTD
jgi:chaperonin GroES